mgnify:CR=1 FL=1|tara:strand:+ start:1122 stop:1661 length:540 start_codon:yes stop_codon:yes gene_type:complete
MAEIKKYKLKDLHTGIPNNGHWGISKELTGEDFNYAPLKSSLVDEGYKPEKYDYICVDDISNVDNKKNVKYGGRRIWLMQNDMSMDQETEIDCEVMTDAEWQQHECNKLGVQDYMGKWDAEKEEVIPPKKTIKTLSDLELDIQPFIDYHKQHPNIPGYDYEFEVEQPDGTKVKIDAGKS